MTFQEIKSLLEAGGGLNVSLDRVTFNEARLLARAAKSSGAIVTFLNCGFLTFNELLLLVKEADGHITLADVRMD